MPLYEILMDLDVQMTKQMFLNVRYVPIIFFCKPVLINNNKGNC